jgi:hypothetical protein
VHGKIVMRGFVKRQKCLLGFRLDGAVIDMDERVSGIVEAEQLAKGRFYDGCCLDCLSRQVFHDGDRIEQAGLGNAHICGGKDIFKRHGESVPCACAVEELPCSLLDRTKIFGFEAAIVSFCHPVFSLPA